MKHNNQFCRMWDCECPSCVMDKRNKRNEAHSDTLTSVRLQLKRVRPDNDTGIRLVYPQRLPYRNDWSD